MPDDTLSYSQIDTYTRCPDKHHYKYTVGYENERWWKPALSLGSFYHELQDARHREQLSSRYVELCEEVRASSVLFDDEKDEQHDLLVRALELVEDWEKRYPYDEEYLTTEESFEYGGFSGTPDAIIQEEDGIIIRDYKTAANIGRPLVDLQPYFYMWLMHSLGHSVLYFEYDYIRTKEPAEPRLKANGDIAYLNSIDTTAKIFLDFCLDNDILWVPANRARYLELLEEEDKWFRRDRIEWDPKMEPLIRVELQNIRAKMFDYPRGMSLRAYGLDACNSCPYTDICKNRLQQKPVDWKAFNDSIE